MTPPQTTTIQRLRCMTCSLASSQCFAKLIFLRRLLRNFQVSLPTNLDMDTLRSLVAVVELGSLSRAAQRLGRGQSALSLPMKRPEVQTGQALFRPDRRRLAPTQPGGLDRNGGE